MGVELAKQVVAAFKGLILARNTTYTNYPKRGLPPRDSVIRKASLTHSLPVQLHVCLIGLVFCTPLTYTRCGSH